MKTLAGLAIVVASSFAAACGGAPSKPSDPAPSGSMHSGSAVWPTCDEVAEHIKGLSIEASGATTDEQKDEQAREIDPALVEIADACEKGWSTKFRSCLLAARDQKAIEACEQEDKYPKDKYPNGPPPRRPV